MFDENYRLCNVLRRSRRQKSTIMSLSRENARLRRTVKGARNRIEALEAETTKLRATAKVLSKRLYGRKSEQKKKPRSERKRGQQRGVPGHDRTQRPEVLAPPLVLRLFRGTPYGTTFWARFLFELCVCLRPVRRIAAWMSVHALAVLPGTLANSLKRFVPLFLPLFEAILRHADETSWRVRELAGEDRSNRAWLWTSVSHDAVCFHIDENRSVEAAEKLFAGIVIYAVIVCDRYSAYKKLVRMLGGVVILAFCWSHMRRDFIDGAAGQTRLTQWCQR